MAYVNQSISREYIKAHSVPIPDGCWIWMRYQDKDGYGWVGPGAPERAAHRLSYHLFIGPIPEGMTVDHLCFRSQCVNPAHLQLLTHEENAGRRPPGNIKKPLVKWVIEPSTHCRNNHEFTPENTAYHSKRGTRFCVACEKERRRVARLRAKVQEPA